ncbi:MAG: hypothetical protein M3433_01510 [Actinomycetota bacterium]|nr:hypothetical protein [Actinomycetota bacterium]
MKLVIEEVESTDLDDHLTDEVALVTSRIALVEVTRATKNRQPFRRGPAGDPRLLEACLLVDVSDRLLRNAAALAWHKVRTLDA